MMEAICSREKLYDDGSAHTRILGRERASEK
jgi:hypothetical protein